MGREVVVVGAGMVGVGVAWHLQARGHRVCLIDRRDPGQETSFGNAGLIQREAVRPYPFPRDLATLLRVAPNRAVDIRWRADAMLSTFGPLLQYWRNSSPERYAQLASEYATLIAGCLDAHGAMIEAAGAADLVRRDGWLQLYRSPGAFTAAGTEVRAYADRFGVQYALLDGDAVAQIEPQLARPVAGAVHWLNSWTVADPGALVSAYAQSFAARGGEIVRASVEAVEPVDGAWRVRGEGTADRRADTVVLAVGPWSVRWAQALGTSLPLFVKRGYHMHYLAAPKGPRHAILDAEVGYVLAPMRRGIRLTTGAELASLDAPAEQGQLDAAERRARELFPLGERAHAEPWKGARPCTPDMKPIIGAVPGRPGLWLACGHGHQGFTLGPVTGKLLAQLIEGEAPDIDMAPFRVDRF